MNQDCAKRVCIFGLSANPPTGTLGHQGIIKELLNVGAYAEIWILPVYIHPYRIPSKLKLAPFEDRLEMSRIAFEKLGRNVFVKATEKEVFTEHSHKTEVVGTAELLDYLKDAYPASVFSLALGSDTYRDLVQGKWCCRERDILRHLKGGTFEVFARGGEDYSETEFIVECENQKAKAERAQKGKTTGLIDSPISAFEATLHRVPIETSPCPLISSTFVRTELLELDSSCSEDICSIPEMNPSSPLFSPALVDPAVLQYALAKRLYLRDSKNPPLLNDTPAWLQLGSNLYHQVARLSSFLIGDLLPLLAAIIIGIVIILRTWFRTFHRWPGRFFSNFW
jgi:nicotinic acid mononucleotide adenylyltransferase